MFSRFKIIIFIVALVALIFFQARVILPKMSEIASSDLFMEETGDDGSSMSISSDMTNYAFEQCNAYIAEKLGSDYSTSFSSEPVHAWGIGNYQYVINADIDIIPENAASDTYRYVCRIKYKNKDDLSDVYNFDNWAIEGINGLDML